MKNMIDGQICETNEDNYNDYIDDEFEKYLEEYAQDEQYIEYLWENMDLFDKISEVFEKSQRKFDTLEMISENFREQYLIDLYISETISLFEGIMHNIFTLIGEKLNVITHYQNEMNVKKFRMKSKIKNNDIENLLNSKTKKILNNPYIIIKLFNINFNMNITVPKTILSQKDICNRVIEIRNAHVHKNGIHEQEKFSLTEAQELKCFYIEIINQICLELARIQTQRIEC